MSFTLKSRESTIRLPELLILLFISKRKSGTRILFSTLVSILRTIRSPEPSQDINYKYGRQVRFSKGAKLLYNSQSPPMETGYSFLTDNLAKIVF
jgi:hypothetical protein